MSGNVYAQGWKALELAENPEKAAISEPVSPVNGNPVPVSPLHTAQTARSRETQYGGPRENTRFGNGRPQGKDPRTILREKLAADGGAKSHEVAAQFIEGALAADLNKARALAMVIDQACGAPTQTINTDTRAVVIQGIAQLGPRGETVEAEGRELPSGDEE